METYKIVLLRALNKVYYYLLLLATITVAQRIIFRELRCLFMSFLGTGHKVQEGVGRKNRILKGTVLVAHPS